MCTVFLHNLNLGASSVIKDLHLQHAHATVQSIAVCFNYSAKRTELLVSIINEEQDERISKSHLIKMCTTRFIERHTAILVARNLLLYIIPALEIMSTWNDPDTNQRAFNLICTLRNEKFITGLVMLENITASLKPLTVYLQKKR